jgi:predicted Zn-dependent peptidase
MTRSNWQVEDGAEPSLVNNSRQCWTFQGTAYQTKRDYYAAIALEWLGAGGLNDRRFVRVRSQRPQMTSSPASGAFQRVP